MFITNEEANARRANPKNLALRFNVEERTIKLAGKKEGSKNLSVEERTDIAIESRLGEKTAIVARNHQISEIAVSKLKAGDGGKTDEARVERVIGEVRDRALDRLMHSLGLLNNDKLSGCNAKDLSAIAANMGRVVEKITAKEQATQVNVVIYSPELKKDNAFESVEV